MAAVGGSNGKTTTKEMVGAILATRRRRSPAEPEIWAAHLAVVEGEALGKPDEAKTLLTNIDAEVNRVGWVQLQNQYDNWKASHWFVEGSAAKTVECRECHMPLVPSHDPARGDDASE